VPLDWTARDPAGAIIPLAGDRCLIPEPFVGPPGNANGGIAIGALGYAALAGATAMARPVVTSIEGRLNRPVPLDRPLGITRTAGDEPTTFAVTLTDTAASPATLLATGRVRVHDAPGLAPGEALPGSPPADLAEALRAMARIAQGDHDAGRRLSDLTREAGIPHVIPHCFVCGPQNPEGLRFDPVLVDDRHVWNRWILNVRDRTPDGGLDEIIATAALDCPTAFALATEPEIYLERNRTGKVVLLGSMHVQALRLPLFAPPGGYRVVARRVSREGRKNRALAGLFDGHGACYGVGDALWIEATITW